MLRLLLHFGIIDKETIAWKLERVDQMIELFPVSEEKITDFADTSYSEMSDEERLRMIRESMQKEHEGAYFEILAVRDEGQIVGFMSLFAHSEHIISISPEIKKSFRGRGYGFLGEREALRYAKKHGYTMAVASVRKDNPTSIALHKKLGFEMGAECLSRNGKPIYLFMKNLE